MREREGKLIRGMKHTKRGRFLVTCWQRIVLSVFIFTLFFIALGVKAQEQPQVKLFLAPSTGNFFVGSTFDVSITVDTEGKPINTVEINLKFSSDKLQIVSPSSGKSFISLWGKQPTYSNTEGTMNFAGGIPGGINTSSGIVSTVTFRAIKSGEAAVEILPSSSVLAHDGKGTRLPHEALDGRYTLELNPPQGPRIFSLTHPYENHWYKNNNPVISWKKEEGVTDFSFVLDDFPQTVPNNISDSKETTKAYEELADGLWYFHVKSQKGGVWGGPSHFTLLIDSTPPASFKPKVEFLLATIIGRAFVSFFTTDALSGLDHYEIAVIDRTEPPLGAPVFIEAESPYQLPRIISGHSRVIVRAVDIAGNVREEPVDVDFPGSFIFLLKKNIVFIIISIIILIFLAVFKRQVVALLRRTRANSRDRQQ